MTAVLGLDVSTKRTGVALPTGRTISLCLPQTGVASRLHWLAGAVAGIARTYRPRLAVIEGYALHAPGALGLVRLAEVGGAVRLVLHEQDVPYIEIPPAQLKRWATSNGAAKKDAMVAAARGAGADVRNDDEADAFLLRAVALHALDGHDLLDHQPDHRATRLDVIAAINWPALHP